MGRPKAEITFLKGVVGTLAIAGGMGLGVYLAMESTVTICLCMCAGTYFLATAINQSN